MVERAPTNLKGFQINEYAFWLSVAPVSASRTEKNYDEGSKRLMIVSEYNSAL